MSEKSDREIYENGKSRRYNLLFAVNGGAFLVLTTIVDPTKNLGGLSIPALSIGMMLFTAIMFIDIFSFGFGSRGVESKIFYNLITFNLKEHKAKNQEIFGFWGRLVLTLICLLICIGWLMIALNANEPCKK